MTLLSNHWSENAVGDIFHIKLQCLVKTLLEWLQVQLTLHRYLGFRRDKVQTAHLAPSWPLTLQKSKTIRTLTHNLFLLETLWKHTDIHLNGKSATYGSYALTHTDGKIGHHVIPPPWSNVCLHAQRTIKVGKVQIKIILWDSKEGRSPLS